MQTIEEFCAIHSACGEGREWAIVNCKDMQEVWQKAKPEWIIWVATRRGVLTDKELRLFAVWSARQVQHLMADPRSIAALDVAERYANSQATDEELAAARADTCATAWDAAWAATCATAWAAAWAAAWDAAWAAAWDAARAAAWDAARSAAGAAARDAARSAAGAAARDAAWAAQAKWLQENTMPNFQTH